MVVVCGQVYDDVIPLVVSIDCVETEVWVGLIAEWGSVGRLHAP